MVENRFGISFCQQTEEDVRLRSDQSILTLETPDVEEIAKAIWQRQHDALGSDAIYYNVKWRDQILPSKFWEEFVLDAHAVLMLLYKKRVEYRKTRF